MKISTLRTRVVLRPTCSTVPRYWSTTMKSPITKGLSRAIESDANKSARMFWTASATAIPPIPRLAIKAVTSTPGTRKANDQIWSVLLR